MQRLINLCILPSLFFSLFFAVMIVYSPGIGAQSSTNCLGQNRCEKWNNVSGTVITAQCVNLSFRRVEMLPRAMFRDVNESQVPAARDRLGKWIRSSALPTISPLKPVTSAHHEGFPFWYPI